MGGSHKGSGFEREICKQLSEWWTADLEGAPRQDVFWRSAQSGGRATQRAKSGLRTAGSYGDITAVDPIGAPLLQLFTLELKRGRSHGCPNDLLDSRPTSKAKPFEQALEQAQRSAMQARSVSWMLIARRDGRVSMAYVGYEGATRLDGLRKCLPRVRFCVPLVNGPELLFIGVTLSSFLECVSPTEVQSALRSA